MSNSNIIISLEKFSAYLDGNLSDSEMLAISQAIAKNDFLRSMVDANEETDVMLALNSDDIDFGSIDESTFELPSINFSLNPQENFELSDIWHECESSLSIDGDFMSENEHVVAAINESLHESSFVESNLQSNIHHMKTKVNYGYEPNLEESKFDSNIFQGNQPSCAIRSQEIIMRDYGVAIPQDELIAFAQRNGWYDPDPVTGGTPRDATGNLLDAVGIETRRYDNASIFDIISELRAGHRVIVSVDADELWIKNEPKLYKRIFGELSNRLNDKLDELAGEQGANHALIVAGVNVNPSNPSDMKVVLIDSGSGDVCIEYSFKHFKKAWDDSHCHMVTTTEPAPYQYNYHTHQMEPSNFGTDFIPSMVSLPSEMQNTFQLSESYFANYENYIPHYGVSDDNEGSHEFFLEILGDDYAAELDKLSANTNSDLTDEEENFDSDSPVVGSIDDDDSSDAEEDVEISSESESDDTDDELYHRTDAFNDEDLFDADALKDC